MEDLVDDKGIDLEEYMTTLSYDGYGDDDEGFYTVYRKVFDELTREEYLYQDEDDPAPPSFGFRDTPYEDVHSWLTNCSPIRHLVNKDYLEFLLEKTSSMTTRHDKHVYAIC